MKLVKSTQEQTKQYNAVTNVVQKTNTMAKKKNVPVIKPLLYPFM